MKLILTRDGLEVEGVNARMKLLSTLPDERGIGCTLTAPRLIVDLSDEGDQYSTELLLVKRRG